MRYSNKCIVIICTCVRDGEKKTIKEEALETQLNRS